MAVVGVPTTLHIRQDKISFIVSHPTPLNVLLTLEGEVSRLHVSRVPYFWLFFLSSVSHQFQIWLIFSWIFSCNLLVFSRKTTFRNEVQITHVKICKGQAFSGANWGDVSSAEGLGSRILSRKTSFPWVNPRMKTREYVTEPKTWVENVTLTLGVASRKWAKEGRVGLGMEKDKELGKEWQ